MDLPSAQRNTVVVSATGQRSITSKFRHVVEQGNPAGNERRMIHFMLSPSRITYQCGSYPLGCSHPGFVDRERVVIFIRSSYRFFRSLSNWSPGFIADFALPGLVCESFFLQRSVGVSRLSSFQGSCPSQSAITERSTPDWSSSWRSCAQHMRRECASSAVCTGLRSARRILDTRCCTLPGSTVRHGGSGTGLSTHRCLAPLSTI